MRIVKILFIAFFTTILLNGQEPGQWRYTNNFRVGSDHLFTEVGLHVAGNWYFADKFEDAGLKWWQADLITFSLGTLWEVKDGWLPRESYPIIGGYGFCPWDLAANACSIVVNRSIKEALKAINLRLFSKAEN